MNRLFAMVSLASSVEYSEQALLSFFEYTSLRVSDRVLLILNDKHTVEVPEQLQEFLTVVNNPSPLSFAENANIAREHAMLMQADLLFLNNDLVFAPGWLEALEKAGSAIAIPFSNQYVQFETAQWKFHAQMNLEDYIDHEEDFLEVVSLYQRKSFSPQPVLFAPFYCVRLPLAVLRRLGPFDAQFGKGGGEDADYCLRAQLEGIPVLLVRESLVLHFMGKSTWRGSESKEETSARNRAYLSRFQKKWGESLVRLVVGNDTSVLNHLPSNALKQDARAKNWQPVLRALLPPARKAKS